MSSEMTSKIKSYVLNESLTLDKKLLKRKIWKNVLVICVIFFLCFSATFGLFSIQSTLHREEGIGTIGLSIKSIVTALSSLFFAPLLIRIIGHKWSIVFALICTAIWIPANAIGTLEAIAVASFIYGLGNAPLWIAQGSYLAELAKEYAVHTNQRADRITSLFCGIFAFTQPLAGIVSETVAATILRSSPPKNFTKPSDDEIQEYCGLNYCPGIESNNTYFEKPDDAIVWTLVGIYSTFILTAILLCIFLLDSPSKFLTIKYTGTIREETCTALKSSLSLMTKYRMWLLILCTSYYAIYATFKAAEFSSSWTACSQGIWMIGYVSLCGFIIALPTTLLTGYISHKIGRVIPMMISLLIIITCIMILLFWSVSGDDVWILFTLSVMFGLHTYSLDPIMQAIHGISFFNSTAAAHSCYNLFYAIIAAIAYGYSYYLCTETKLYILIGALICGYTGYFLLEYDIMKKPHVQKQQVEPEGEEFKGPMKNGTIIVDNNLPSGEDLEKYTKF